MLVSVLILLGSAAAQHFAEDAELVIRGRVTCHGKMSGPVYISLTDSDRLAERGQPLSLVTGDTMTGSFEVSARALDFDDYVDPVIEILHNCARRCAERSRLTIPWEYALERGAGHVHLPTIELSHPFPDSEKTTFCQASSDSTWSLGNH